MLASAAGGCASTAARYAFSAAAGAATATVAGAAALLKSHARLLRCLDKKIHVPEARKGLTTQCRRHVRFGERLPVLRIRDPVDVPVQFATYFRGEGIRPHAVIMPDAELLA